MKAGVAKQVKGRRGFSLVELLVAVAVLALVLVLSLRIAGGALSVTKISHQKMEASEQARTVFDSLEGDLLNLIAERYLPVYAKNEAPGTSIPEKGTSLAEARNSQIAFLTQSRGPRPANPQDAVRFMGVAYQLTEEGLKRFTLPVMFSDPSPGAVAARIPGGSGVASTLLAKGILRFEVVAGLEDGTYVSLAPAPLWNDDTVSSSPIPNGFLGLNLHDGVDPRKRVCSLVVGIVSIDEKNLRLLAEAGKLEVARKAFETPVDGRTPLEGWERVLDGRAPGGALDGIPRAAVNGIQVSQHTYRLR